MDGYKIIRRGEVPEWLRDVCEPAAIEAAHKLGIPPVTIYWRQSTGGRRLGWADPEEPGVINLVSDVLGRHSPGEVKALVFHECYHVRQHRTGLWSTKQQAEADAQRFSFLETGYLVDDLAGEWEI